MPIRPAKSKLLTWETLDAKLGELRARGLKLVTTNGCFDVLHWGHLSYLEEARKLGDGLLVLVNSDASVKQLKGPTRPVHPQDIRSLQLGAIESVDFVLVFNESTPIQALEKIRPAIHVKGGDYDPQKLPERQAVENGGGKIIVLPFVEGFSSTRLISD